MGKGMRAGKKPKAPKNNQMQQMQAMQAMQAQMEEAQAEIDAKEIETTAGGGAVKVKINGKKEILELNLDQEVVDPDDVEMLQDLVMAAINEAMRQVDEMTSAEMEKLTGGMGLPPGLL